MDRISADVRSKNMSAIRSKGMKPELLVRSLAHRLGYRFRLHRSDLPGKPDLVFASRRKVVFVNGCFWHQHDTAKCRSARIPKSNEEYWVPKLARTVARDKRNRRSLNALGWQHLTVWECETRADNETSLSRRLRRFLEG